MVGGRRQNGHVHRRAAGLRQILHQHLAQTLAVAHAGLVETVEVKLETLRLDDVTGVGTYHDLGQTGARPAGFVQPAQFIGIPDILAEERQRILDAQAFAGIGTRDRKQQARIIAAGVLGRFAQKAVFKHQGVPPR